LTVLQLQEVYDPRYAEDLKEREEEFVSSIMMGAT
jgi:hypothetical protein